MCFDFCNELLLQKVTVFSEMESEYCFMHLWTQQNLSKHVQDHADSLSSLCEFHPKNVNYIYGKSLIENILFNGLSVMFKPQPLWLNPYQLSSSDMVVPLEHIWKILQLDGKPPQGKGMLVPLPQSCTALTLVLESWIGLCPHSVKQFCTSG